jgi:hypothetical protein
MVKNMTARTGRVAEVVELVARHQAEQAARLGMGQAAVLQTVRQQTAAKP